MGAPATLRTAGIDSSRHLTRIRPKKPLHLSPGATDFENTGPRHAESNLRKGRTMTESKAKPKAKGTSRANKPPKSATKSKALARPGAKAKPGASHRATGKPASRLSDRRIGD